MEKLSGVMIISVFLLVLVLTLALITMIHERRRKKAYGNRFRAFRNAHNLSNKDLRAVPRISIPESMDVILALNHGGRMLRSHVADISLSGLSVTPKFLLKRLDLDAVFTGVRVDTPINSFFIRSLKLVRKEKNQRGRFMAFSIFDIDENQFEELKLFLKYLNDFLVYEQDKN